MCACVSVLFLLLNCDVRVFYSFIFSIGIFSIYILSSCNLTLVLKSRVHTDAIRIHDDDDDETWRRDWPKRSSRDCNVTGSNENSLKKLTHYGDRDDTPLDVCLHTKTK